MSITHLALTGIKKEPSLDGFFIKVLTQTLIGY